MRDGGGRLPHQERQLICCPRTTCQMGIAFEGKKKKEKKREKKKKIRPKLGRSAPRIRTAEDRQRRPVYTAGPGGFISRKKKGGKKEEKEGEKGKGRGDEKRGPKMWPFAASVALACLRKKKEKGKGGGREGPLGQQIQLAF